MSNALNRRWTSLTLVLLLIAAFSSASGGDISSPLIERDRTKTVPHEPRIAFVPHQLVVRLSPTADGAQMIQQLAIGSVAAELSHGPVFLLTLDPNANELAVADDLSQSDAVAYAHPNYILNSTHPIQGSYPFPDQERTGNFLEQPATTLLNLTQAHATATGSGVTIGILDGGIDFGKAALGGMAISGYDFVDNDANAFDELGGGASGHGTFVAGLAHLTAPGATLRAYRIIDQHGYGNGFALARAIEDAVDDGCQVINISLALMERHLAVRDAINYAVSQGAVVIAGAGNSGSSAPVYPAAELSALAVAAVDNDSERASFSNFGTWVDVCAPGENLYSLYTTPDYAWWSGTSFSAPFVSGLAALLRQHHPTVHGLQISGLIKSSASNIDAQNPPVAGLLGRGLINPVASLTAAISSDTAVFFPDTVVLNYYNCSEAPYPPRQTGLLMSSNQPAAYSATVDGLGGPIVVNVEPRWGVTGDSVTLVGIPSALPIGTYFNEVIFEVEGVIAPATVTVQLNIYDCEQPPQDGAWVVPGEMWFSANLMPETTLYGAATLYSENAPAQYQGEIVLTGSNFTSLIEPEGFTDDSVRFLVHPSWMFSAGNYTDTILYHVNGIAEPARLLVHLAVSTDSLPPNENAYVSPPLQGFTALAGTSATFDGAILVGSNGAAKTFVVGIKDQVGFTRMVDSLGTTNDLATFQVVSTPALAPGLYVDTLVAYINGAPNSPLYSVVLLTVSADPGGDTALALPNTQQFTAPDGVPTQSLGSFVIYASGSPKVYSVAYKDTPDFTNVLNPSGFTNDSVTFAISPMSTLPGDYVDTLVVSVSGVINSPVYVVNRLFIDSSGTNPPPASASVTPTALSFTALAGSNQLLNSSVFVSSSNAPANFVAYAKQGWGSFVVIPDSVGLTNENLTINCLTGGRAAGVYWDTVAIHVSGVTNPLLLPVTLTMTSAAITLELWNSPNPFNPSTEIGFTIPEAGMVRLDVYNALGQLVTTLVDQPLAAGTHRVVWNGSSVPSGVYFYRLSLGANVTTKKMILLK